MHNSPSFVSHHASDKPKEDIRVTLKRHSQSSGELREWWIVSQVKSGFFKKSVKTGLDLYIFSDQVSPPSLGFLAGYG